MVSVGAALGLGAAARPAGALDWAVDYGAETDPATARRYRLLVLEPDHDRAIASLRGPGATLLGYVSFGEVERQRPYVGALEQAGALLAPNPHWPDARMADLRHPAWRDVLIETIVPQVLAQGFDGIFIDTMDNAEAMETRDPAGMKGMAAAGAALIAAVRARFPAMRIMLNRGYAILPGAARDVDYVLGEAMASRWNFAAKRYEALSGSDWEWQATRLRAAKARNPRVELMTLDYCDPADRAQVAALYAREREAGFRPYVSTLALDRLYPEAAA